MSKGLHLFVNTWKRPELAGRVLARIAAVKQPSTAVTVLVDGEGELPPGESFDVKQATTHMGCGLARRWAIATGTTSSKEYLMFLDDDVFVRPGFDRVPVELWKRFRDRHPGCFGSAFRDNCYWHLEREVYFDDYVLGTSISGACQIMDREQACWCVQRVPDYLWDSHWDWNLAGLVVGAIRPYRTFLYHVGFDKSALHENIAYDFDHLLQREFLGPC